MTQAYIIAARRTAVAPRNGAFGALEVVDLGAPLLCALLSDAGAAPEQIDDVILGSALYGGGNPARLVALAAGLPEAVSSLSIDSQCCSGLDAILLAASRIRAGEAQAIIAGGVESYSRSPLRYRRPTRGGEAPVEYLRPPFSPWPDRDPDLIRAAADLALERGVGRAEQAAFAVESHRRARFAASRGEIVPVADLTRDAFTRDLSLAACLRAPLVVGERDYGLSAATIAVEADAAAATLVVSEDMAARLGASMAVRIAGGQRRGVDPGRPALGASAAACALLERRPGVEITVAEIMEAFAVQAMATIADLALPPHIVNRGGGALARGHPIGASGAILVTRLFHELAQEEPGAVGVAAIAAAGGLGSAALLAKS